MYRINLTRYCHKPKALLLYFYKDYPINYRTNSGDSNKNLHLDKSSLDSCSFIIKDLLSYDYQSNSFNPSGYIFDIWRYQWFHFSGFLCVDIKELMIFFLWMGRQCYITNIISNITRVSFVTDYLQKCVGLFKSLVGFTSPSLDLNVPTYMFILRHSVTFYLGP